MRKSWYIALGLAAAIAAACGSSGSGGGGGDNGGGTGNGTCADGGPGSCTGCCDTANLCQAGNGDMTCGTAGGPCEACSLVGLTCNAGACGTPASSGGGSSGSGTEAGASSGASSGSSSGGGVTSCSAEPACPRCRRAICCLADGTCGCTTSTGACM